MTRRVQLAIDASAGSASVALFIDDVVQASRRIERQGSAELLAPTIAELLAHAGIAARELTDVIVGGGPGSFTGLRVAAALGKGLARGSGARLHAVPSLPLIATANADAPVGTYLCVLDALRGEWFVQMATKHVDNSWSVDSTVERVAVALVHDRSTTLACTIVGPPIDVAQQPDVSGALQIGVAEVSRDAWEPNYGRLAEAQVQWETAHARPLPTA